MLESLDLGSKEIVLSKCSAGIGAVLCLCFCIRKNRFSHGAAFIVYYIYLQGLKLASEAECVAFSHPYHLSKKNIPAFKEYLFSPADIELFTFEAFITFIKRQRI